MAKKGAKIRKFENAPVFEKQFEKAYSTYFKHLFLYARKITHSDEVAEDVVSDVFFDLWSNLSSFKEIREIEPYLFISVKNHAIRTLYKISRDPGGSGIDRNEWLQAVEKTSPEDVLLEKEILQVIENEIARLPDQCQLIFKMVRDREMKYEEVAKEMDISVASVKTQMHRATSRIRECIADRFSDDSEVRRPSSGFISLLMMASASLFFN